MINAMEQLDAYGKKYPELVYDIVEFFLEFDKAADGSLMPKTVLDFFSKYKDKYKSLDSDRATPIPPRIIVEICEKLCGARMLTNHSRSGIDGIMNRYMGFRRQPTSDKPAPKDLLCTFYNCVVYGYKYIYDLRKQSVLPIVHESKGRQQLGTCFKALGGIVTAKHCIENAEKICILGVDIEKLKQAKIFAPGGLDLAFINIQDESDNFLLSEGEVLDDVLVMGYPKIGGFDNFVTGEQATISSKAELRLTPTKGSVAAVEGSYVDKCELMLITARIHGGNSGGPVVNNRGQVIGITLQQPNSDGDYYENLGYGVALPAKYLSSIKQNPYNGALNFVNESDLK